ncbi:MAG: hypothetical protein JJU42_01485 [Rhodobacteraceae bacterium]|nr:hypothetical protein [Paracoccaceae bacterium]
MGQKLDQDMPEDRPEPENSARARASTAQADQTPADLPGAALLEVIEAFCRTHGIAASTLGRLAVNDGKLASRIARGSRVEPTTRARIEEFMERVNRGEIELRGRPRRKKSTSNAYTMAELVNRESSIRTPGSFAIHEQRHRSHVFAATTNESWVQADMIVTDLLQDPPPETGLRLFYSPMDNGVTLTRVLRAIHARHPGLPILVVMKGWGLEDLRNTMGRMIDRLIEHPQLVFVLTNLYTREAVHLKKTAAEGPRDLAWHEIGLTGRVSYDYQLQLADLFPRIAPEWCVRQGPDDFPVYSRPSVVTIMRADQRKAIAHLLPRPDGPPLAFDYAFLNHPYLHSHTMKFRVDYILAPIISHLAPGGRMKVVQSLGSDPAHEIIQSVWPNEPLKPVSRHDIISALRKARPDLMRGASLRGLTDARSLYRFDMHTLPTITGSDQPDLSLQGAWSNAVYFARVREQLVEAVMRSGTDYLDATRKVLLRHRGLWFVNEAFEVQRKL